MAEAISYKVQSDSVHNRSSSKNAYCEKTAASSTWSSGVNACAASIRLRPKRILSMQQAIQSGQHQQGEQSR